MAYKDWSCKDTPLEAVLKQTVSGIDVMDWGELADMVLMLKDALAECNATCEGLDSYAAVCVANVQRMDKELESQLTAATERERVLVEALKSVLDEVRIIEDEWDADWPMPYPLVNFLESTKLAQARAALAAKE